MQKKKKKVLTDTSTYHMPSSGSCLFEIRQSLGSKDLCRCVILMGVMQEVLWRANTPGIEEVAFELGRSHVHVE